MRGRKTNWGGAAWAISAAVMIAASCATGAEDAGTGSGGEGGDDATSGALGAGGGGECGAALDRAGCKCFVDEAPRPCFTGLAEQAGVGACVMGTQLCEPDPSSELNLGNWGACAGSGQPGSPGCDGSDKDCDGAPDPACGCLEGSMQGCSTVCGSGTETCVGGSWVNCTAPQPNPDASCPMADGCMPGSPAPGPWEAYDFNYHPAPTPCNGPRYARYFPGFSLWVGAILCNASRYKLFLSSTKDGTFYQIGDYAGHGQDHCELVNLNFTIPNEDDIKSGCASCDVGPLVFSDPGLGPGWSRAWFGDCFAFEASWPQFNLHSTQWYECGVTIP
jgi:hypothetical protein